jgi:hypothetical protein
LPAKTSIGSFLKFGLQHELLKAEVHNVASNPTLRTSPAADRVFTIGRRAFKRFAAYVAFAGLVAVTIWGIQTPAQARPIAIPPRTISVFYVAGSPNAPTVHLWDHFNRVNTSSLGRAVVGGNWTSTNSTWTIAANKAKTTATQNAKATLSFPGIVGGQLEADLTFGSTAEAGLTLLDDGISNLVLLYKRGPGTSQVRLYSLLDFGAQPPGPLPTPVATFDVTPTSAAALKVLINGNIIEVWWNNTSIITYGLSPAEISALKDAGHNRFGFWAESDALTRFDNLRLQTLPSQP